MATVRIDTRQELPPICICCGAASTRTEDKKFERIPFFAGLLFGMFGALFSADQRIKVPLCDGCGGHWKKKRIAKIAIFVIGVLIIVGLVFFGPVLGPAGSSVVFYLAAIVFVIALVHNVKTTVRPKKIDVSKITLSGVATEFAAKLAEQEDKCAKEFVSFANAARSTDT